MHPLAITLVLISAAIHALRELIIKRAHDKQIFAWLICLVCIPLFFPLLVYEWLQGNVTWVAVQITIGAGVVHSLYWYWMTRAYDGGDLSHVYPIMRSAPALIVILSILFLGEHVTLLAAIGVVTILLGIYMINMKKFSLQGFLEPIESLREKHTQFALITACAVTAYSLQDKIVIGHMDPLLYAYALNVIITLYWAPFIYRYKTRVQIRTEWERSPRDILLNAVIGTSSYALILVALTMERVSYVASLRQISIVFGVLLGGHLLQERHKWIRLGAAGMIFTGTVMIAVAK